MNTQEIGQKGEEAAVRYLIDNGFEILHRNWRSGRYELDITARRDGVLHIIEVKCRKAGGLTCPEEAMTRTKFNRLLHAARHYIALYKLDIDTQFDLIAVDYTPPEKYEVRYIPEVMNTRW